VAAPWTRSASLPTGLLRSICKHMRVLKKSGLIRAKLSIQ